MGRGYAEGPAAEALHEALERGDAAAVEAAATERVVWGSTPDRPEPLVLGRLGDVDPDELFRTGRAWGIRVTVEPAA